MTRFVVVPQWQGSPSARAMQLVDGAHAIAGDLPSRSTTVLDVPLEAGESLDTGVQRVSTLVRTRRLVDEAIAGAADEHTVLVGGDCGISPAGVAASARSGELAVVWFDAHPDLHTPSSSPSGAFGGMALRAVLGDGVDVLSLPRGLVAPDRVVLVGARSFDDAEDAFAAGSAIRLVPVAQAGDPSTVAEAVRATGASRVYIHVDLDVLDPADISGVSSTQPFGMRVTEIVAAIAAVREALPLAGGAVCGFSPPNPEAAVDDLGAILRIIGALA